MSENIVDAIVSGAQPHEIAQEVKDALFAKSVERIDTYRKVAAANMFGSSEEAAVEGGEE